MSHQLPSGRLSRHNPNATPAMTPRALLYTTPGHHSFSPALSSDPNDPPPPVSLDIAGKIGTHVYQLSRPWIAQGLHSPTRLLQLRAHVMPRDPRTFAQMLVRARTGSIAAAWRGLTDHTKQAYRVRAARGRRPRTGYQLFASEYCAVHPLAEFELHAIFLQATGRMPPEQPTE